MYCFVLILTSSLGLAAPAFAAEKTGFEVSGISRVSYGDAERRADRNASDICLEGKKTGALRIGEFKYSNTAGQYECDVRGVCRIRVRFFAMGRYACTDRAMTNDEIDSILLDKLRSIEGGRRTHA